MEHHPEFRRGARHRRSRTVPGRDVYDVERVMQRNHRDAEDRDRADRQVDECSQHHHRPADCPDDLEWPVETEVDVEPEVDVGPDEDVQHEEFDAISQMPRESKKRDSSGTLFPRIFCR
jgi:hypothetical protein